MGRRSTRIIFATVLVPALAAALAGAAPPGAAPSIERARTLLYTDRDQAISILEEAARQSPGDPRVWSEYVNALDVDGFRAMADLAARHALRLRPRDPDLLVAHARVLGDGAAIDVLAALEEVPGYEKVARDAAEWVSMGIAIPDPFYQPLSRPGDGLYCLWVDRLVTLGKLDRAGAVVDEALTSVPPKAIPALLARKAVVLALRGRFDEALDVQRAAGFRQERLGHAWCGAADVLLSKDKPDLAVAAFGGAAAKDDDFRRLLAVAKLRAGDPLGAASLLPGKRPDDALLLLRVRLADGQVESAKTLADQIVGPLRVYFGSYFGSFLGNYHGPLSLGREYAEAVRWLLDRFPDRRQAIEFELGRPEHLPAAPRPVGWSLVGPMSRDIPELEARVKALPVRAGPVNDARTFEDEVQLRRWLSRCYEKQARFDEAAEVLEPLLLVDHPPTRPKGLIPVQAVRWATLRRRAVASRAAEKDFWRVADARRLIREKNAPGLVALGVPVLADVLDRSGAEIVSRLEDFTAIAVVRELGHGQDAPMLIQTLQLIADGAGDHPLGQPGGNAAANFDALNEALETMTNRHCPAAGWTDRAAFWGEWWRENRSRIVESVHDAIDHRPLP
jgi:tetratricopeptide (TPR) repeat protein